MAADLPAPLLAYLATREAQRAEDVDSVLAALTERERRLIREAAVMGYVQGRRHPATEDHPKDTAVLHLVVDACLSASDLYPILSGIRPCGECRHPEYNHRDGEDSDGVCLECDANGSLADAHHDYRLRTPS